MKCILFTLNLQEVEVIVIDDDDDPPEALVVAPEGKTSQEDQLRHPADVFKQKDGHFSLKEIQIEKAEMRKRLEQAQAALRSSEELEASRTKLRLAKDELIRLSVKMESLSQEKRKVEMQKNKQE